MNFPDEFLLQHSCFKTACLAMQENDDLMTSSAAAVAWDIVHMLIKSGIQIGRE